MKITVRTMTKADIPLVSSFPSISGGMRPKDLYVNYYNEQETGKRLILLAFYGSEYTGHVTIVWKSNYPPFTNRGIPEIKDLAVRFDFHRHGIASALMDEAETIIFKQSPVAGIAVGLYSGYGPAQAMYARRNYVPDARGIMYRELPVTPGEMEKIDDDLLLYMTKKRPGPFLRALHLAKRLF